MRKFLLVITLFCFFSSMLEAQTLRIDTPAGLAAPYEVDAGTLVTITAELIAEPTTFFTHPEAPVFPDFGKDDSWTENNFVDNGDGTYSLTLTVNKPVFIWTGTFSSWTSQWQFSEVLEIGIASGVKITATDGFLCPTPGDTESISATEAYPSYQWYFYNEPIDGATSQNYSATTPGQYKVKVPLAGNLVFSNTLTVKEAAIAITGLLTTPGQMTLSASSGFDSYIWSKGTTASNLAAISGATNITYNTTLTGGSVYYAVKGTIGGCDVTSEVRAANIGMFTAPTLTLAAEANGFGKICKGTEATLSVSDNYASYTWYNNGNEYFGASNSITVYEEKGPYFVKVTTTDWPEIPIKSNSVSVPYFEVLQPELTGVTNYAAYCPGENLSITLNDEGYTYHWYVHHDFNYSAEDEVTVGGPTFSFSFAGATYITVVAQFMGCESSALLYLDSYENASLFLELNDNEQEYLCPGKTVVLSIPQAEANNYENFQWYTYDGETEVTIAGQTSSSLIVNAPGKYFVKAHPKECNVTTISSYPKEIYDYTARELYVYADKQLLCEGEQTTLIISDDWTNIQWFKKEIVITSTGYDDSYTPLANAGTTHTQVVNAYNSYLVKAKHKSCATGLKTTSFPIQIAPAVNPNITTDPSTEVYNWHKSPYDSAAAFIYCVNAPVKLHVDGEYESITWYKKGYNGDSDYSLGTLIADASGNNVDVVAVGAEWFTAKVVSNGCTGFSDPIILDTWVHNSPAVEVFNNGEICGEDGSALLRLAFYGDWVKYEWYNDGELIPDSDNDSLLVTEPGLYTITGYPSACPHIGYSSGMPANVVMFPQATIEETDDVIYAMPEYGFYNYQWFLDGEPIEPEETPWIRTKANMLPGVYTVEVTNPQPCSSVSAGYVWTIMGTEEDIFSSFTVYPNPTSGAFAIGGLEDGTIKRVSIYTVQGNIIHSQSSVLNMPDMKQYAPGVYIVEVELKSGARGKRKIVRQ